MRDDWESGRLGDVARLHYGKSLPAADRRAGAIPVIGSSGAFATHDHSNTNTGAETVVVGRKGTAGSVTRLRSAAWVTDTAFWAEPQGEMSLGFLYLLLQSADLPSVCAQTGVPGLNRDRAYEIPVRFPTVAEQRRIVDLLDAVDDTIAAARDAHGAAADTLASFVDLEIERMDGVAARFGDVMTIERGGSPRPIANFYTDAPDGLNWVRIGDVASDGKFITHTEKRILPSGLSKTRQVAPGDFVLSNSMSFGRPYIMRVHGCIHDGWLKLSGFHGSIDEDYLYHLLRSRSMQRNFERLAAGSSVRNLNKDKVAGIEFSLPSLGAQQDFSARMDQLLETTQRYGDVLATLSRLRSNLLTVLLSGEHEIPASYDEVMEVLS